MYVKAPMHIISIYIRQIQSTFRFLTQLLPEIWEGSQNPRWRRGCAHVPLSRKKFNTVEAPNLIYSCTKFQLSN